MNDFDDVAAILKKYVPLGTSREDLINGGGQSPSLCDNLVFACHDSQTFRALLADAKITQTGELKDAQRRLKGNDWLEELIEKRIHELYDERQKLGQTELLELSGEGRIIRR